MQQEQCRLSSGPGQGVLPLRWVGLQAATWCRTGDHQLVDRTPPAPRCSSWAGVTRPRCQPPTPTPGPPQCPLTGPGLPHHGREPTLTRAPGPVWSCFLSCIPRQAVGRWAAVVGVRLQVTNHSPRRSGPVAPQDTWARPLTGAPTLERDRPGVLPAHPGPSLL